MLWSLTSVFKAHRFVAGGAGLALLFLPKQVSKVCKRNIPYAGLQGYTYLKRTLYLFSGALVNRASEASTHCTVKVLVVYQYTNSLACCIESSSTSFGRKDAPF
jgi:hypothetical protein